MPVWIALPELRGPIPDCAIMGADRSGRPRAGPRRLRSRRRRGGARRLREDARAGPRPRAAAPGTGRRGRRPVPGDDAAPVHARLAGSDAVASDDVAPVLTEAARGAVAVDRRRRRRDGCDGRGAHRRAGAVGAQARRRRPPEMPAFPDRAEDLAGTIGVLLDDPPGLTPEQRHALGAFLDGGGVALPRPGPARVELRPWARPSSRSSRTPSRWTETRRARSRPRERRRRAGRVGPEPHRPLRRRAARPLHPRTSATWEPLVRIE